jgi:hypothetical protein
MALPTLNTPKYQLELPSTKEVITYRPFLVKEEKILLIAQETKDPKQMMMAMRDIISACTFEAVKTSAITGFDLEYIFLKLRSKSVGENADIKLQCTKCEEYNPVSINLDQIIVDVPENANAPIMLTDSIGITLKYVTAEKMEKITALIDTNQMAVINELIINSIDTIFDDENVYPAADSTPAELTQFIESLNRQQMEKIENFIANAPKLQHTCEFKCNKCEEDNSINLQGIQSFFE